MFSDVRAGIQGFGVWRAHMLTSSGCHCHRYESPEIQHWKRVYESYGQHLTPRDDLHTTARAAVQRFLQNLSLPEASGQVLDDLAALMLEQATFFDDYLQWQTIFLYTSYRASYWWKSTPLPKEEDPPLDFSRASAPDAAAA
mgnify:CR=1 FL=1